VVGSDGVMYRSNMMYGSIHSSRNVTNVPAQDLPLYQTGSYMPNYFELPIAGNGLYTLTLKFPSLNEAIPMDVTLGRFKILENYDAVVNGTNDQTFPFEVYNSKLIWEENYSDIQNSVVPLVFNGVYGNRPLVAAMKMNHTPAVRPEQLLQDIRDDLRKLVTLLEKKETKEL
jgi:Malectin domain